MGNPLVHGPGQDTHHTAYSTDDELYGFVTSEETGDNCVVLTYFHLQSFM
jgi:hypothetical protein